MGGPARPPSCPRASCTGAGPSRGSAALSPGRPGRRAVVQRRVLQHGVRRRAPHAGSGVRRSARDRPFGAAHLPRACDAGCLWRPRLAHVECAGRLELPHTPGAPGGPAVLHDRSRRRRPGGGAACPRLRTGESVPAPRIDPASRRCTCGVTPCVRAVAMKGVVSASMASPASHARAGEDAWRALVGRCGRDTACAKLYRDLAQQFDTVLSRLDENPIVGEVPATPDRPSLRVRVTRGLFAEAFRTRLYTPESMAGVPALVRRLASGDRDAIAEIALGWRLALSGDRLAAGFFLSVSCAEERHVRAERLDATRDRHLRRRLPAARAGRRLQGLAARHRAAGSPSAAAVARFRPCCSPASSIPRHRLRKRRQSCAACGEAGMSCCATTAIRSGMPPRARAA